MKITNIDLSVVTNTLQTYLDKPIVKSMNGYIQHSDVTTLQHCINVAIVSYIIVRKFNIKLNLSALLIGALLHDFYLYDWHDGRLRSEGLHGFSHPAVAADNAKEYFQTDSKVDNIIRSHMFPLTITKIPKSKEALIVSIADKICAIKESLHIRIYKPVTC